MLVYLTKNMKEVFGIITVYFNLKVQLILDKELEFRIVGK